MKKQQYIVPATTVVRVESMNIMAGSPTLKMNMDDDADEVTNYDELLSRRGNLWADEEDL